MTNDAPETPSTDKDAIEADIERTREDLAETIDALAARLDVTSRTKDRLRQTKDDAVVRAAAVRDRATDDEGRPTPVTLAVAGGVVIVAVLVVLGMRRRAR